MAAQPCFTYDNGQSVIQELASDGQLTLRDTMSDVYWSIGVHQKCETIKYNGLGTVLGTVWTF